MISGDRKKGIPQGAVKKRNLFEKLLAFIRGNYFIPDARKGWIPFAVKEAMKIFKYETLKVTNPENPNFPVQGCVSPRVGVWGRAAALPQGILGGLGGSAPQENLIFSFLLHW